jgi:CheY-like chemotaxis protein
LRIAFDPIFGALLFLQCLFSLHLFVFMLPWIFSLRNLSLWQFRVRNVDYIQEVKKVCLGTVVGWEVLTASSGKEGIIQAENDQLDVMMPDMDGLLAFEQLQPNPATKEIPVVLLTAKIQAADLRRYA